MKIKLKSGFVVDTKEVRRLHNKPIRLVKIRYTIKPKYSVEFLDGTFEVLSRQEYKLLSKVIVNEEII